MDIEHLILDDAIETAIKAERGRIKYKIAFLISLVIIGALMGIIGGMICGNI